MEIKKEVEAFEGLKKVIEERIDLLEHYKHDVVPYGLLASDSMGGLMDDLIKMNPTQFKNMVSILLREYRKELKNVNNYHAVRKANS